MAGKVLTMAQQKGGAGKTTLVAQLAVALAANGRAVAMVDIDPQGSLSQWFSIRNGAGVIPSLHLTSVTGWRAQAAVEKLKASHDLVLVDSAPHAEIEAKIAVRLADLIIVPVQPSPLDLWATEPTLALARSEKRKVLIVINRVQTRMKLAETLTARIADLGADIAEATIGNRTSFAASMMDGRGVIETAPKGKAAMEMLALADEITRRLPRG
ncbi:MAG: cobyrinic acid a,c-diamide synthase [Rhodospirillales bacterium]|nr:cobyrinic acid a,c-diamide synthase [Rhodospirillales bacterium]